MFSSKFYIDHKRNNTLMLRITNNRKKQNCASDSEWTRRLLLIHCRQSPNLII